MFKVLKHLNIDINQLSRSRRQIKAANGTLLSNTRVFFPLLKIRNHYIRHRVYVSDQVTSQGILGRDILSRLGTKIDLATNDIVLKKDNIDDSTKKENVLLKHTTFLEANEMKLVTCTLTEDSFPIYDKNPLIVASILHARVSISSGSAS